MRRCKPASSCPSCRSWIWRPADMNVARVAFKRSAYLRNFVYKFAELVSDKLDRATINQAMSGRSHDYDL